MHLPRDLRDLISRININVSLRASLEFLAPMLGFIRSPHNRVETDFHEIFPSRVNSIHVGGPQQPIFKKISNRDDESPAERA